MMVKRRRLKKPTAQQAPVVDAPVANENEQQRREQMRRYIVQLAQPVVDTGDDSP